MDEDDAEPVVDVEVEIHVVLHEPRVLLHAADDRDVGSVDQRRYVNGLKMLIDEDRQLRQYRDGVDNDDSANHVFDRTQLLCEYRVTYADISTSSCATHEGNEQTCTTWNCRLLKSDHKQIRPHF